MPLPLNSRRPTAPQARLRRRNPVTRWGLCALTGLSLLVPGLILTAADLPPAADPTPAAAEAPQADAVPQFSFLLDYLYAQGAWAGELTVPYRPDIQLRLVDLLTPEEAKAFKAGGPSAAVVDGFREAEKAQGSALAKAYLEQLRTLAQQLSPDDQALAEKLIVGMVEYQAAIYRPNRLFAPPEPLPPANLGYRRMPQNLEAPPIPDAPPARPGGPAAVQPPAQPAGDAETALNPDDIERLRRLQDRARNETWMKKLNADELTRVAAFLATPRTDIAGVAYYDRSLRLFIGRMPVRLSELFDSSPEFRRKEILADIAWKRRLVAAAADWQKNVTALRSIAAQEQASQVPTALRPGLIKVLQVYHQSLSAQQALQNQYEGDLLALTLANLPAEQRTVIEKRRDEYPNAMRTLVEQYGRDLEAAWTEPLERAVIAYYTRTKRLDYVKEHLHEQGKTVIEQAEAPNPDQF